MVVDSLLTTILTIVAVVDVSGLLVTLFAALIADGHNGNTFCVFVILAFIVVYRLPGVLIGSNITFDLGARA